MRITFPFKKEKANIVEWIPRPLAEVTLINEDREVTQWMYADSGADISLIPYSVGKLLKFILKPDDEIKEIGGIGGGKVSVVVRKITLKIGSKEFRSRIAWCLSEDVPLILGRLDVFDVFKVCFDQKENITSFEEK